MSRLASTAVTAALLIASFTAHAALPPSPTSGYVAETFDFKCIAGCSFTPAIGDQLFLQVIHDADTPPGDPAVYFKFWNLVGTRSSVVQVSIDGMSAVSLLGASGATFSGPTSAALPGGAGAGFVADVSFPAIPFGGLNTASDHLELVTNGATFDPIIAGIHSGNLRFGLFVTDFSGLEVPATYVNNLAALNNVGAVPEPSAYALLFVGLGMLVLCARRRA